jgi:hypothetical protein
MVNKEQDPEEEYIAKLAEEEFKDVADEGLFPNHSDKEIWTSGFRAGYIAKRDLCDY